jgi:hypothetical protein
VIGNRRGQPSDTYIHASDLAIHNLALEFTDSATNYLSPNLIYVVAQSRQLLNQPDQSVAPFVPNLQKYVQPIQPHANSQRQIAPSPVAAIASKICSLICVYLCLSAFICGKNLTPNSHRQFS